MESLTTRSSRRLAVELLAASFVVLFLELTLIRFLPGQVRILAYYPNLVLLGSFLGLGVGCLRAGRASLLAWLPACLLVTVTAAAAASRVAFTHNSADEYLWLFYFDLPKGAPVVRGIHIPLVVAFVMTAMVFLPLGQIVAERIRAFQERSSALAGYAADIVGSLAGVLAFSICGFLGTPPLLWFGVALATVSVFFLGRSAGRARWLFVVVAPAVLFTVASTERAEIYSPYYALSYSKVSGWLGRPVLTNGSVHQIPVSLRRDRPPQDEAHRAVIAEYHEPYRRLLRRPARVLVLGAGTGNDVSVALDEGAERVDAVEIDPAILELGRKVHPDRPYQDPRVHLINTDARSFLRKSQQRYDLIVLGTLDSMTQLSALANVRLDNYVYTKESFAAIADRVTPDGGAVMYFSVHAEYIDQRLAAMSAAAFGTPPVVLVPKQAAPFTRTYLNGGAFAHVQPPGRARMGDQLARLAGSLELPVDDWPYLYVRERGLSSFYLSMLAILAAIAVAMIGVARPDLLGGLVRKRHIDGGMFLFGLGFLLLETKSVTEMNLLWGATWITNAVVFGGILTMVLASTLLARRWPVRFELGLAGVAVSLLVAYLVPARLLLGAGPVLRLIGSTLLVALPIFFASTCFATLLGRRRESDQAFGWNLVGAVAGGLVESVAMAVGFRALSLIALVAYLIAGALWFRSRARVAT